MQANAENVIEAIRGLSGPEQEKVWHWLDETRRPKLNGENGWNERAESFNWAIDWIEKHRTEYLGQWVCLDGDKLVAHGTDAREVYKEAKSKNINIPFIKQVREEEESPYWGGWV